MAAEKGPSNDGEAVDGPKAKDSPDSQAPIREATAPGSGDSV
jgi:hypothetical protein